MQKFPFGVFLRRKGGWVCLDRFQTRDKACDYLYRQLEIIYEWDGNEIERLLKALTG
jgi:hypothetical protein